MTEKLFTDLRTYFDNAAHSAPMNMALDEALLESATVPSIRFYEWDHDALSFGYFGRFKDVQRFAGERDLVRRWTGGGIVFHGTDLTYSIVIPRSDPAFDESSMSIYEKVHRALCNALFASGNRAELSAVAAVCDRRKSCSREMAAVTDRRYKDMCFENPVRSDVMIDGHKIAGAAQRRTKRGLLQQGSIQHVDRGGSLGSRFAQALSQNPVDRELDPALLERAKRIATEKYGSREWLQKR